MIKLFEAIVEAVYWFLIFLSPMLIATVIAAVVYFNNEEQIVLPLAILGIGFVGGVLLAERIRRKYGCSTFYARLMRTGGDDENRSSE